MLVTKVHIHFNTTDTEVMERKLLRLLSQHRWNITDTAHELGISRQGLFRIIGNSENLRKAHAEARLGEAAKKAKDKH